jgi:hypothetical protein
MKDARGHGSNTRGAKFLSMGGRTDPNRPAIQVHVGPSQVFGHFMNGEKVDKSWADDQVGRGKAQFVTVPVRDEAHSEALRSGGAAHQSGINAAVPKV